jgi:S1-C subfamily serine protease
MRYRPGFAILVPEASMGTWNELSSELSTAIEEVGESIFTVQAGGGRTASGILLEEQLIITTARAVAEHETIRVWMSSEKPLNANLVGIDSDTDIGLLKLETKTGRPAVFADDPKLSVGRLVLAIGRTWRGNLVASAGILSGVMGEWYASRGNKIEAFIRPDLNLYSGFSGGALIGADRKVIGMNTGALRRGSPLTVPNITIKRIGAALKEKGYVPKPYLGLGLQPVRMPESLKKKLNLTQDVGALVVHVDSEGPSDKAGLLLGDILLRVEGADFGGQRTAAVVLRLTPNKEAKIHGMRGGQQFSSTVLAGERPRRQA